MGISKVVKFSQIFVATNLWRLLVETGLLLRMPAVRIEQEMRGKKRLLLDVGSLHVNSKMSGTNRVTQAIAQNLLVQQIPCQEVILVKFCPWKLGFYPVQHSLVEGTLKLEAVSDTPLIVNPGDTFLGLDLSHIATIAQEGFLRHLQANGVTVAFVIYDLLPIDYPQYFELGHGLKILHRRWLRVVSHSNTVLPISKSVNRRWLRHVQQARFKSHPLAESRVIRLGSDFTTKTNHLELRDAGRLPEDAKFVLCVGTIEPRKRVHQIVEAMELLWSRGENHWLVIVGRGGWLSIETQERIRHLESLGEKILWIDSGSDTLLASLYSRAALAVVASTDEGYGLPVIEALAKGAPVLARDIEVFQEVGGSSCMYFAGDTGLELAQAIKMALRSKKPTFAGLNFPTWTDCAEDICNALKLGDES